MTDITKGQKRLKKAITDNPRAKIRRAIARAERKGKVNIYDRQLN